MKKTLSLLVVIIAIGYADGARILGIFPMPARSHYILGSSLMKALAEQGHDVTIISPFSESFQMENGSNGSYKNVVLTGFCESHSFALKKLDLFGTQRSSFLTIFFDLTRKYEMILNFTNKTLNHKNVQKFLNSQQRFDLIIMEEFLFDALKAVGPYYNAPLVLLSTLGANKWVNTVVGNPNILSYVPEIVLGFPSKMSFFQRVINVLMYLVEIGVINYRTFSKQAEIAKKFFPNGPDLSQIFYNVSLVLLNSHLSTNAPVPYVPTMIDIGGFHIKPPKQLPLEFQNFMDNAIEGVVYFSFGSMVRSTDIPPEKLKKFLNTFSKLKLKVLLKWEEDELPGKPANVHIAKWLPQQEILAHPNIKLFITHGGLMSAFETIYHGVPVLAIPLFGDHRLNAQALVDWGVGIKIEVSEITEATLTDSINQLLSNPKFAINAKRRCKIYHDRLVDPMKTAIYWIEYVLRHGTSHLKVAGLDLPWYKYYLLDVIGFMVIVCLFILFIIICICKKIISLWLTKSEKKLKKP